MNKNIWTKIIITFILFINCVCVVGCTGKPYDLSELEAYVNENYNEIIKLVDEANKAFGTKYDYISCNYNDEGGYEYTITGDDVETKNISIWDEKYCELIKEINRLKDVTYIEKTNDNIRIKINNSDYIIISEKSLNELYCPMSQIGQKKWIEIESYIGQRTFICDYRKDRSSYDRGMYYQFDYKEVINHVYVGHLTTKYPWYSCILG